MNRLAENSKIAQAMMSPEYVVPHEHFPRLRRLGRVVVDKLVDKIAPFEPYGLDAQHYVQAKADLPPEYNGPDMQPDEAVRQAQLVEKDQYDE